jgi:hypothetical protein
MEITYAIGIDLGTSNSALALTPLCSSGSESAPETIIVPILQLISPQTRDTKQTLPSALYLCNEQEQRQIPHLPWQQEQAGEFCIGNFARKHGALQPDRLVTSAKSWLCTPHLDPKQPILPWQSTLEERKISPYAAQVEFLSHLRHGLINYLEQKNIATKLEQCAVTITVPASFDEIARVLTAEAAEQAGWGAVNLLEEQQAAFYHWLEQSGDSWREQVELGDIILICDIGGGTADFSLIAATDNKGELQLERISVGDHILLGGDNMDLALAYTLKAELDESGKSIDNGQLLALIHSCCIGKEALLNDDSLERYPITIPSRGAGLFARSMSTTLTRQHINSVILEGFFPLTTLADQPLERPRSGLHEAGLNYAYDPVLSKHLAHFLVRSQLNSAGAINTQQGDNSDTLIRPTAVLFNGGIFKAQALRQRVMQLLQGFYSTPIRELSVPDSAQQSHLDLAVAKGAAVYTRTKVSGTGIRIKSGTSRSYYIGIESSLPAIPGIIRPLRALCVVPQGMEEGSEYSLDDLEFGLTTGQAVEFSFFSSNQRSGDSLGTQIDDASELDETANLEITLSNDTDAGSQTIPVKLHSKITELGTLELWMQQRDSQQRWKIEFNVREK